MAVFIIPACCEQSALPHPIVTAELMRADTIGHWLDLSQSMQGRVNGMPAAGIMDWHSHASLSSTGNMRLLYGALSVSACSMASPSACNSKCAN